VSATDPDWKERILAAAEGRHHEASIDEIQPYHFRVHADQGGNKPFVIEVRPRAGVWAPFIAAIPMDEKDAVDPSIMVGPKDFPTNSGMLIMSNDGFESDDGQYWAMFAGNEATPTTSYYVWCSNLPTQLIFGPKNGTQYVCNSQGNENFE